MVATGAAGKAQGQEGTEMNTLPITAEEIHKLLSELCQPFPSTAAAWPQSITRKELPYWIFHHSRPIGRDIGEAWINTNFDCLLLFWYIHMDCDPWTYNIEEHSSDL